MTSEHTPIYDKSKWSRGEWDTEPDRVDFLHAGFSCFILRNHHGTWCGYVGVPSDHPCYEKDYNDVDVDVHGGLTYAAPCYGHICHVPEADMPDKVWWLGFDTGHANDLCPSIEAIQELSGLMRGTYKNMEYVMNETRQLADQLKVLED